MTAQGGASPFTAALLKHIAAPGVEIDYVPLVRDDVMAATTPPAATHLRHARPRASVPRICGAGRTGAVGETLAGDAMAIL